MTSAPTSPDLRIAPATDLVPAAEVERFRTTHRGREMSFVPVLTLVTWMGCLAVGVIGLTLHYSRPRLPQPPDAPIQAEILHVELTSDPLPPPDVAPSLPTPASPPPLSLPPVPPAAPPMIAVAEPTPAVAFAVPVKGPTRVAETRQAAPSAVPAPVATPAPAVQTITYGYGEGKQPAPSYPPRALREGQEGTVSVRFSVAENGRVAAAEAAAPSPWPLLNQEAVRVVRERWRFRAGPARLYEVSIRFELRK